MAITRIGSATGTANGDGATVTVMPHASTAVGDMMLACFTWNSFDSVTTPASGWTLLQTLVANTTPGSVAPGISMYYKIAVAGDLGTGFAFSVGGGSYTKECVLSIHSYRGVKPQAPASGKGSDVYNNTASPALAVESGNIYVLSVGDNQPSSEPAVSSPLTARSWGRSAVANPAVLGVADASPTATDASYAPGAYTGGWHFAIAAVLLQAPTRSHQMML